VKPNQAGPVGALDSRRGLEAGRYFLVPGRTDFAGKGLDVLLAAHDGLENAWPAGIQVVFVGPPGTGHSEFLRQLQKSDDGRNRLLYLGRVEDGVIDSLYAHCLATVIPSRSEGFGFPVLEAMEHGVPVVCSNAGSLPEVVGDAALLFDSGDAMALAGKLKAIAAESSLRSELVARGRVRLRQFSWEKCAQEMMAVFEAAARTRGGQRT
jgi:alpha-1,3-rhamnosyl/mannosyltransferase